MTKSGIKKILIIVGAGAVIAVAFQYLGGSSDAGQTLVTQTSASASTEARDVEALLQKMAKVQLDRSIFSDPNFQNLKDNTVIFNEQPAGRSNPFAPIGND